MKKIIYLLLFALTATMIVSCAKNEGEKALAEMEKITETAEKNKDKLTREEWKKLAIRFEENEKIANEAAEAGKIGVTDRIKLIAITTRWAGTYGPYNLMNDISEELAEEIQSEENPLDSLNNILGSIKEALTEDKPNEPENDKNKTQGN